MSRRVHLPTASFACVPAWHEDFRKDLAYIDVPTLVMHGDADRILPISASGIRTAKMVSGSRLVVVPEGPHCIIWTHADEVNRELVSFLAEGTSQQRRVAGLRAGAQRLARPSRKFTRSIGPTPNTNITAPARANPAASTNAR